jgi:hypothetical protein
MIAFPRDEHVAAATLFPQAPYMLPWRVTLRHQHPISKARFLVLRDSTGSRRSVSRGESAWRARQLM